jgi:hypothetical protein
MIVVVRNRRLLGARHTYTQMLPCRKWRIAVCMCQMKGVELTEKVLLPSLHRVQCFRAVELGYSMFKMWTCHLSWHCLFHGMAFDPGGKQFSAWCS